MPSGSRTLSRTTRAILEMQGLRRNPTYINRNAFSTAAFMHTIVEEYQQSSTYQDDLLKYRAIIRASPQICVNKLRTLHSNHDLSRFALMKELHDHIHSNRRYLYTFCHAGLYELFMDLALEKDIYILGDDLDVSDFSYCVGLTISYFAMIGIQFDARIYLDDPDNFLSYDRIHKRGFSAVQSSMQQ